MAIIILSLIVAMPFFVWALLWYRFDKLKEAQSKIAYGSTYMELRYNNKFALLYNVVYMLRRLVFTAVANFLGNSPTLQVQLIVMHSVIVLMYIKLARPFESPLVNFMEVFNEFCILIAACHLFCFTEYLGDPNMQYKMGFSMIGVTVLNIVCNMLVMIVCTGIQLRLNYLIMKVRYAYWQRGAHISVFWKGIPKIEEKERKKLQKNNIPVKTKP